MKKIPEWFKAAVIYQIYPRVHGYKNGQFGTLVDIQKDLPRIKSLGANTLWLMPVQPSGQWNRKGLSGSPYAIKDYKSIAPEIIARNPVQEYTSEQLEATGRLQFKDLIDTAHGLGFRVVLDFVGNHCAPDNVLLDKSNPPEKGGYHPEWFLWENQGESNFAYPLPPCSDWTDTADLNYGIKVWGKPNFERLYYDDDRVRQQMWEYMFSVLEYWVQEFDIDGYRCDFAHWVPLEFWQTAISRVKKLKPDVVFFAEAYERLKELLESGFDGVYAFELYNQLKSLHHEVRHGDPYFEVRYIKDKINYENSYFPPGYRMIRYTENHDEIRSVVMYGGIERTKPPFLLALTLPGVPMIYAGQECGETVRPPLFEGNFGENEFRAIDFSANLQLGNWYRDVLAIRASKPSLFLGDIRFIDPSSRKAVVFLRKYADELTVVAINFNFEPEGERLEFCLPEEVLQACSARGGQLVDLLEDHLVIQVGSQTVEEKVGVFLRPLQSLILELRKNAE